LRITASESGDCGDPSGGYMGDNYNWEDTIRAELQKLQKKEGCICDGDVILFIKNEVARILGMLDSYLEDDDKDLCDVIADIKKMYRPHKAFEVVQVELDDDVSNALKDMANKSNCTIDFVVEQLLKKLIGKNGEL
jgi:hypothetical protein